MHLPSSNIKRLYTLALAVGLGLGVVVYALLIVLEQTITLGPAGVVVAALAAGLLIGVVLSVAIKLALRQLAYDLRNDMAALVDIPLPSPAPVAIDEVQVIRDLVNYVITSIPRAETFPALAKLLLDADTFEKALVAVTQQLRTAMPISGAAVLVLDEERQLLQSAAVWGDELFTPNIAIHLHETILGRVLSEQRTLHYSAGQARSVLPQLIRLESGSLLCLPLIAAQRTLGMLCLGHEHNDLRLGEEQQIFVDGAVDLFGLAVHNLQLRQLIDQESARLSAFEQLTVSLNNTQQLDHALGQVLRLAAQVTESEHGTLLLLEADEEHGRYRIAIGPENTLPLHLATTPVLKHGLAGWAIRERRADIIDDTNHDERWLPVASLGNQRSVLVVPLLYGERVLGVLTLASLTPHHYTQRGLALVSGLAAYAVNTLALVQHDAFLDNAQAVLVRNVLDQHLSADAINSVLADADAVDKVLQPSHHQVVVMTIELRGLEQLATTVPPDVLFDQVVTPYLTSVGTVIHSYQGYLLQHHAGHAIAVFGYPLASEESGDAVCNAALAIRSSVQVLRDQWRTTHAYGLHATIGIAGDTILAGIAGSGRYQTHLMLGAALGRAWWIEGLARNGEILLDDRVFAGLAATQHFHLEALDPFPDQTNGHRERVYRLLPAT